ncbi:hypothetical protein V9K92_14990 [Phyllobacterium sp. CCNWLW109]|uniref:hypothetical protein n=1 Tax=Phyllobacterium sp. CCNWLW109 TaxID=3127479 RepID=UPI003076AA14
MTKTRRAAKYSPTAMKTECITKARERSSEIIGRIPRENKRSIAVYEQIAHVCERLLSAAPPIEPTHQIVSEQGGILYPGFVVKSTISKHYADIVRIWSAAFSEVGRISIQKSDVAFDAHEPIASEDRGHIAEIEFYRALIKRQTNEMKALRNIIAEQVPIPTGITAEKHEFVPADGVGIKLLRDWLRKLKHGGGPLELTAAGIEIAQTARPGRIVMDLDTWRATLGLANLD